MALWQSKATTLEKQVEDLQASISTLTAERDEAVKAAEDLQEQIKAAEDAVSAAVSSARAEVKAAAEAHAKALADAKAEHDAKVESEVISRIASAGIPPIRRDPSASAETGDNTMTREAFVKLSPAAQSQFCLKGGRIQG